MRQIGSPKTVIIFDILDHQGRFVDNSIFGDTGFEINAVSGLDKLPQTNRRFNLKRLGFGFEISELSSSNCATKRNRKPFHREVGGATLSKIGEYSRSTKETTIEVKVNLEGSGQSEIEITPSFFKHMLESFATHSMIDLYLKGTGDLTHHIVEDTAIVLGRAMKEAISEKRTIRRFGSAIVPMDCSRCQVALDLSNRAYSVVDLDLSREMVEDMAAEDIYHFFRSISDSLGFCLHIKVQCGTNDHHKVESAFKAFALALRDALTPDVRRNGVPSSKGVL